MENSSHLRNATVYYEINKLHRIPKGLVWNKGILHLLGVISNKRKSEEIVGALLNKKGNLVTEDAEKAKVLDAFFPP